MIEQWSNWAAEVADELDSYLPTVSDFRSAVESVVSYDGSPIDGAAIKISSDSRVLLDISLGSGEMPMNRQFGLGDAPPIALEFSVATREPLTKVSNLDQNAIADGLFRLSAAYWKAGKRDTLALLPSLNTPGVRDLVEASVPRMASGYPIVAALFADLDDFKALNDAEGQTRGDQLIAHVGDVLRGASGDRALVTRLGGDEFLVWQGVEVADEALSLARTLMTTIASDPWEGIELRVKVGIALAQSSAAGWDATSLQDGANRALVSEGVKQKGRARFAAADASAPSMLPEQEALQPELTLCRVTTALTDARPFSSPWLNLLSADVAASIAARGDLSSSQAVLDAFIEWARPAWKTPNQDCGPTEAILSPTATAFAVAHGMLRGWLLTGLGARASAVTVDTATNDAAARLRVDGEAVISIPSTATVAFDGASMPVVSAFFFAPEAPSQVDCRRSILLVAGRGPISLPEALFRDVIRVDDRPTRQGGLPDFWEAGIAQIASRLDESPNVDSLYLMGALEQVAGTVGWIDDRASWSERAEYLTKKTGLSVSTLERAAGQLKTVTPMKDTAELMRGLAASQARGGELRPERPRGTSAGSRFLRREITQDDYRLPETSGIRVAKVGQAYPIVLDRLRSSVSPDTKVVDESGHELVELRDFVIKVDGSGEPEYQAKVPAAYSDDVKDLEAYFKAEFLNEGGIFADALRDQQRVVVAKLAAAIRMSPKSANRRAMLVVPHDTSGGEMNPVGLVAVRIAPRAIGSTTILAFSFVWRTVEAVVGLPYSLYGSARFSEHLAGQIATELSTSSVPLGELSYTAMSLHMRLDDYSQQVARRVVEDASL